MRPKNIASSQMSQRDKDAIRKMRALTSSKERVKSTANTAAVPFKFRFIDEHGKEGYRTTTDPGLIAHLEKQTRAKRDDVSRVIKEMALQERAQLADGSLRPMGSKEKVAFAKQVAEM